MELARCRMGQKEEEQSEIVKISEGSQISSPQISLQSLLLEYECAKDVWKGILRIGYGLWKG
jgi:hypothetical protein